MKVIRYFLVFLFSSNFVHVQGQVPKVIRDSDVVGIYKSLESFKANTIFCSRSGENNDSKVKLNQFFISSNISCKENGQKFEYSKDSIFAIHLTNGDNYRFINLNMYKIIDTSYLYIYTYSFISKQNIQNGPTRRTKETLVTQYFFSTGNHNVVYELTMINLCKNLKIDPDLKVSLNKKFSDEKLLPTINSETGRLLLNEYLKEWEQKEKKG